MLGAYTSEAVKDWAQILRAYEKDGIYLAEVAAEIQRAGMYEMCVPRESDALANVCMQPRPQEANRQ